MRGGGSGGLRPLGARGATGATGAAGATGPAGPAPSGTGLVSVTAGVLDTPSTLAARLALETPAVIDASRSTAYAFADATGVTLVQGSGTAAVTGGQVVFTTASGANTAAGATPTATIALPAGIDPWRGVDITVRLAGFTGTLGGAANRLWFSVASVADAPNNAHGTAGDWSVAVYSQPDGALLVGDQSNGVAFANRGTTAAGALLLDTQDWLRLIVRAGGYVVLTGRGSTRPTVWTRRLLNTIAAATASAVAYSQPSQVTLAGYRNGAQAEAHVVTFDDLLITGLL